MNTFLQPILATFAETEAIVQEVYKGLVKYFDLDDYLNEPIHQQEITEQVNEQVAGIIYSVNLFNTIEKKVINYQEAAESACFWRVALFFMKEETFKPFYQVTDALKKVHYATQDNAALAPRFAFNQKEYNKAFENLLQQKTAFFEALEAFIRRSSLYLPVFQMEELPAFPSENIEELYFLHGLTVIVGKSPKRLYKNVDKRLCYHDLNEKNKAFLDLDFIFSNELKEYCLIYYGEHLPDFQSMEKDTFWCVGKNLKTVFENWKKKVVQLMDSEEDKEYVQKTNVFEFFEVCRFRNRVGYFENSNSYVIDLMEDYTIQKENYPVFVGAIEAASPRHGEAWLILGKNIKL